MADEIISRDRIIPSSKHDKLVEILKSTVLTYSRASNKVYAVVYIYSESDTEDASHAIN